METNNTLVVPGDMSKGNTLAGIGNAGSAYSTSVYDRISNPMEAVKALGQMISSSEMFGIKKLEQGCIFALAVIVEKKSPFDLMKTYHVIGGKLEMKATAMHSKFKEVGGKVKWMSGLMDREQARAIFATPDGEEYDFSYTIEDAKIEGHLGKDTWKKSGPDMLRSRLLAKAIRMLEPGINSGMYDRMELSVDDGAYEAAVPVGELLQHAATAVTELSALEPAAEQAALPAPGEVVNAEFTVEEQPKPEPKAEPKPKADKKKKEVTAATAAAVSAEPKPEPVKAPVVAPAVIPEPAKEDTIDMTPAAHALDETVGEEEADVNAFLIFRNYIKEGETYRSVSDELAEKIIANAKAFLAQVRDYIAKLDAQ